MKHLDLVEPENILELYDEIWKSMISRVIDENDMALWQCIPCLKTFKQKNHAREHVEAKHMNVCYTCNICEKSCKSSASLRMHMGKHKGDMLHVEMTETI